MVFEGHLVGEMLFGGVAGSFFLKLGFLSGGGAGVMMVVVLARCLLTGIPLSPILIG